MSESLSPASGIRFHVGADVVDSFLAGSRAFEACFVQTRQEMGQGLAPDLSGNAEAMNFEALMEQTWRIISRTCQRQMSRKSIPEMAVCVCL